MNEVSNEYVSGQPYSHAFDDRDVPHPVIVEVRQISRNQLLIAYDQQADLATATRIQNYWIRSNKGVGDIASLNMEDGLSMMNSLRPGMATIEPVRNSRRRFLITFKQPAMRGVTYIVLPCYVGLSGQPQFGGANWGAYSHNTFVGM
ncbi:hypothetical protein A374_03839 [Fictibacillus macauensis ZFHKF-1]|uniref:Uncharacterized protein n=2 Tax=Fictibacillus TaxID=1329200 RepID=I8ALA9_9BACL|nr:hypothetical protein A374_03839 [Fictibacillus macauensis ZFHKF-1]